MHGFLTVRHSKLPRFVPLEWKVLLRHLAKPHLLHFALSIEDEEKFHVDGEVCLDMT